jgi:carbon-monoxide dehydrogenase small subunit
MSLKQEINFTLNGQPTAVSIPVELNTLSMLRNVLHLNGTKLGCGEGECGACTILVDNVSTNACIMFAVDCDGREITTIEGIQTEAGLDVLQQEFVAKGAVQCGFCTPGLIMQGTAMLRENSEMTEAEIKRGLEGNLCRCTGYKKVIDACASALEKTGEGGQA